MVKFCAQSVMELPGSGSHPPRPHLTTLLLARDVKHAVAEGDALDLAYPTPRHSSIAFRNLAAFWANCRALGYYPLIGSNSGSALEVTAFTDAMGDQPGVITVLLAVPHHVEIRFGHTRGGCGRMRG